MDKKSLRYWGNQVVINRNLLTTAEHLIRRIEVLEKQVKELSDESTRRDDGTSESSGES